MSRHVERLHLKRETFKKKRKQTDKNDINKLENNTRHEHIS